MNLTRTNTTTALAIIPKEKKARPTSKEEAPAKTSVDGVDIKGFNGDAIPADDDGPGAGGGYKPQQDPVEGPGSGGGYDGDEVPADDDGPGAGGGYETEQDPAESDGPGAGGGYVTEESTALTTTSSFWNQPLTVFSATNTDDVNAYNSSDYTPHWVQILPQDSFNWTVSGAIEPLMLDANGKVVPVKDKSAAEKPKKEDGK